MAGATPAYDLPYLGLDDAPDIAGATEDLATAVETELSRIDANVSAINGLTTVIATESTTQPSYSGTTYTTGSTTCAVVFTAPKSGMVVVHWKAFFQAGITDKMAFVGCEIRTGSTIGSGSVLVAANSADALAIGGTVTNGIPIRFKGATYKLITALTPGAAYHARLMYQTETSGNITVFAREVMVVPQL